MGLPRRPLRSSLPLAPPVRPAWALVESAGQVHGAAQLRWFRITDPAHSAGQDSGPLRAPIDWRLSGLFVFAVDCSVTVTVFFGHNGEGEEEAERETVGTRQTILRDLRRRIRAAAPSPRPVLLVELPRGGVEKQTMSDEGLAKFYEQLAAMHRKRRFEAQYESDRLWMIVTELMTALRYQDLSGDASKAIEAAQKQLLELVTK